MTLIELISAVFASLIGIVSMISSIVHVIYSKKTYHRLCTFCKSSDCSGECTSPDLKFEHYITHYSDFLSDLSSGKVTTDLEYRVLSYYKKLFTGDNK